MLAVYNYMAIGVALTGVAAWLTFQLAGGSAIQVTPRGITGLTDFGRLVFSMPGMIGFLIATFGLVLFISFRIDRIQPTTALALFLLYAGLLGVMLSSIFIQLYRRVDHPGVLHLGGLVRRAQPLRLHHQARPVGVRRVPDHGPGRPVPGDGREHLPAELRRSASSSPSSAC